MLLVSCVALERLVVRPERGRGELGRAVVRHAVVLRCDGVEQPLRVLRRPRRLTGPRRSPEQTDSNITVRGLSLGYGGPKSVFEVETRRSKECHSPPQRYIS